MLPSHRKLGLNLSVGTFDKILSISGLQLPPEWQLQGGDDYLVVVSLLLGQRFHGQGSQAEVMLQKQGVDVLEWHLALGGMQISFRN